jgi:isoleucyl-tRNA synthetase
MDNKVNYKDTLNLPRTSFKMKAGLPQKEPGILKKWEETDLYKRILESRAKSGKTFILHDGPPYANGHIHVGHVLNKLLKDFCVKHSAMKGYYAPYVPGWDCHGLPVEHQLFKELGKTKNDIGQVEFRKKAYRYAMKYVDIQKKEFKRVGVFGDWDNPYLTLTKDYEANVLFSLADLYEKGYVYKGLKPVNWCRECETALAEAEVEYEDRTSPSIYVKFASAVEIAGKKTFFIIWTTTPWTLLANVAVALHPDLNYSAVDVGGEVWIILSDLVDRMMKKFGINDYNVLEDRNGGEIVSSVETARHPFLERDSVLVTATYVTKEEGTGCVHTAPGHGQDDYVTGKKFNLPVIMPVDKTGRFTEEAGNLIGKDVLDANPTIIDSMRKNGTLILAEDIVHSYPHCWRCKTPIIFRATEQWFMNIDHNGLREKLIGAIDDDVEWIPNAGADRIGAMVKNRPDWCLSRQRYWGVPIPAIRCVDCDETFTDTEIIRKVASLSEQEGADVWFEKDVSVFLPEKIVCGKCGGAKFAKEEDILDVWFDSGVSHRAVLDAREGLNSPADLYLEGSDQHRGWFQAALITSMAMNERPPYKKVLTHGFVVDSEGKKMSKSVGNVISPDDVMKKFGADILRLWVASSDYDGDIKLSDEILARLSDGYRKMRNTFRFLLSNLYDFDPASDMVDIKDLTETDRWMLSRLSILTKEVNKHYASWEFYKVYRAVYDFCVLEVSAFYLDVLKDVLYIVSADSTERRSGQTVIFRILHVLTRIMAPILAFTSEEVWDHMVLDGKEESVHMSAWPDPEEEMAGWEDQELDAKWKKILAMRDGVLKTLELKREEGMIGSPLEAKISLYSDDEDTQEFLKSNVDLFPFIFRVSQATILNTPQPGMQAMGNTADIAFQMDVSRASGMKCPRCWNYSETVGNNKEFPELCERCYNVMIKRSEND